MPRTSPLAARPRRARMRNRRVALTGEDALATSRLLQRVREDSRGFLRCMKAHRVLRFREVEQELRSALREPGFGETTIRAVLSGEGTDVSRELNDRIQRDVPELVRAILNLLNASAQLVFRKLVAGLTSPVDVEYRASDVMVADLHRTHALIGHVTVCARDARSCVNALVVELEFRVLRLEHGCAAHRVHPILMPG